MIQACYHGDAEVVRELVKDLSSAELSLSMAQSLSHIWTIGFGTWSHDIFSTYL